MSRFTQQDRYGGTSLTGLGVLAAVLAGILALLLVGAAIFTAMSFKGVDVAEICVVKEGGPFDGREIKEVRQPGSGPKPIGAFNSQHCLPATERDDGGVVDENLTYPTEDSVQVIADGKALYELTEDPKLVKSFYEDYGGRNWGTGEDAAPIDTEEGFLAFQRERIAPVIIDATREVLGQYDCIELNNLCQYVQNPDAATKGDIQKVNTNQNLAEAQRTLAERIQKGFVAAFGEQYFENVRYQNLRIQFEEAVKGQITEAQKLRTETANAKLAAQKAVETQRGEARAAKEAAKKYNVNPTQEEIDKIRAFCGNDGCDPQVIGQGGGDVIASLSK